MKTGPARLIPLTATAGAPVLLRPGVALVAGRDPTVDLSLADPDVSRQHAVLEERDGAWRVRDLDSGNGTFVNGRRVQDRALKPGDEIRFGRSSRYRFFVDVPIPAWRSFLYSLVRHELVPRAEGTPEAPVPVGTAPVLVGRGDRADLRLPVSQVSELHARLETRSGRPWVHDHRSRNGTWVNGDRVTEQRLRPGDEVAFADQAFDVRLGKGASARGMLTAAVVAGALVVVLVVGGLIGRRPAEGTHLWTRQMYEERATRSLEEAFLAFDRRPPALDVVQAQFDIAVRSLVAADRLRPDVQTVEELRRALGEAAHGLGAELAGRDPYDVYASLASRKAERIPEPVDRGSVTESELSRILGEFGIDTATQPIPPDLLAEVERNVDFWSQRKRDYTQRAIARSAAHLEGIRRELRQNRLPEVFCHLPFVESGYRVDATSPAGARGMWQFMPRTARGYGLEVTDDRDDRIDPTLSTRAACQYLDGLLSAFGADAFMCAVAAYNKGEYGMVTCLKKISWRSRWKFWELVQKNDGCLRKETIEYVPRFLAAAIVMRRPEVFGLEIEPTREGS